MDELADNRPQPTYQDFRLLHDIHVHLERCDSLGPDPAIARRLTRFMRQRPGEVSVYRRLVKRHPTEAVRLLMYQKMREATLREHIATRMAPLVKEWTKQIPGLHEMLLDRIRHMNHAPKSTIYAEEAFRVKQTYDTLRILPW
jgi:hypothetical protein